MSLELLKKLDPGLIEIPSRDGKILVSNHFQGRIFCEIDGILLHRFVEELAKNPDPVNFNNLGGNSLWPAPEGGPFAFNYPCGADWTVQPGINSVRTTTQEVSGEHVRIEKEIELVNRKGTKLRIGFSRQVFADDLDVNYTKFLLKGVSYRTIDILTVPRNIKQSDALISAWSLEQFPGAEEVYTFGCCENTAENAVNTDFYGDPLPRLTVRGKYFGFRLGGEHRLQIGVAAKAHPLFIGAYNPRRNLVVLRSTELRHDGRYFNIADNDQPSGPWSAGDMFSIFNGSRELDFHELETIAPVNLNEDGTVGGSVLESRTFLLTGERENLRRFLTELIGVPAEFLGEK
ncbi:MAG: hypothetical protein MJ016_02510 [Victivallaceae bacterium]|nr:hypothetical protein [Victivallaceae bacterium]